MAIEQLQKRFDELTDTLAKWQNSDGYWKGELSSSALAVAVASVALNFHNKQQNRALIEKGMLWLTDNINEDGGFGDTAGSRSNISTSLLCYSCISINREFVQNSNHLLASLSGYLINEGIDLSAESFSKVILNYYKTDRTFSVPILVMSALCGVPEKNAFENIPQLPFELALLPRSFYRLLNFSVVSYAMPALIAVGLAIFRNKTKKNLLMRIIRQASIRKSLILLEKMLPASGGYLEAVPLTAFVSICLINAGHKDSRVVEEGISFLKEKQRNDGSWAIDTDLSSWVTSLAVKAMGERFGNVFSEEDKEKLLMHYISIQQKEKHSFNASSSGGWGWTNCPGSVSDVDDTAAALLSVLQLTNGNIEPYKTEIEQACNWLLAIQNADDGFPTFSRGWGKLPFDRSCADLTGHAILALAKLIDAGDFASQSKIVKAVRRGVKYLTSNQDQKGALLPLWFGNQLTEDHANPVYGTARVVAYLNDLLTCRWLDQHLSMDISEIAGRGKAYLLSVQNIDGSWGGAKDVIGSIEETALALSAVHNCANNLCIQKGIVWLDKEYKENGLKSSPIGLYFASLWYDEKMYPLTAYLEILRRRLDVLT